MTPDKKINEIEENPLNPRNILIACGDETNNTGDESILSSTIYILKKLYPNSELRVFANNPDLITQKYRVKALPKGESLSSFFGAFFRAICAIKNCNLFIWGGGQLVQDISSQFYIPNHIWRFFLAILFKKQVIVFAIGASLLKTGFSKFLVRWHLQRAYRISVRDLESAKALERIGIATDRVTVLYDPALAMKGHDEKRGEDILKSLGLDMTRPIIGFAPRRLFHRKHGLLPMKYKIKWNLIPSEAKAKFDDFMLEIAESLSHAISSYNTQILFIPMYKGLGQEDDRICREIADKIGADEGIYHLPIDLSSYEVQSVISKMNIVIGVRMHALILAASCGVSFIGINYAPKGESFCRMMGMEEFGVKAEDFNTEWLNKRIKECLDNKTKFKKDITDKRDEILNSASLMDYLGVKDRHEPSRIKANGHECF